MLQYHCAHERCDGRLESHHRFLLESTAADCSRCLDHVGVELDADAKPVTYYPPTQSFAIWNVPSQGWKQFGEEVQKGDVWNMAGQWQAARRTGKSKAAEEEHDHKDGKSISDVDSIPSYWSKDSLDLSWTSQDSYNPPQALFGENSRVEAATKHRNLIYEQLSMLPHHIASSRQQRRYMYESPVQETVAPPQPNEGYWEVPQPPVGAHHYT